MKNVGKTPLAVGSAGALSKNGTIYAVLTEFPRIPSGKFTDQCAILIGSTAGQITVTQQVSADGETWYDPVDNTGAPVGSIVSGMTSGTQYVVFTPIVAPYTRFKVEEDNVAASTVTMTLIPQEEL